MEEEGCCAPWLLGLVLQEGAGASVASFFEIMDSRAILRADMGFYIGRILRPLLKSLHNPQASTSVAATRLPISAR